MTRPNIILLTIDTLRVDRVGCYGHKPSLTPHLDALVEEGVYFYPAITGGSWTQAAFPVMMTSTYASMYGGCLGPLAAERPSPVTFLTEQGYATGGFSTSPLLSRQYHYEQGFDYFHDLLPGEQDPGLRKMKGGQRLLRLPITHVLGRLVGQQTRPAKLYANAADLTAAACAWIERVKAYPFFAWIHYMDVHWPYHLEEMLIRPDDIAQAWHDVAHLHEVAFGRDTVSPEQKQRYIQLYETAVQYTDSYVGHLRDYLAQAGLADNTVIIVVADHGEEFLDHGRWGHFENNLFDEILKVPLLFHLPGYGRRQRIDRQVHLLDLMPTILDLCNCPPPTGMLGQSLRPLWQEDGGSYDATVFISEMWREHWHIISVRNNTYKYIWDSQKPEQPQLYHLLDDPHETQNVLAQHPTVAAELHTQVEAQLQRMAATRPDTAVAEPVLDESVVERLRGLGYVD